MRLSLKLISFHRFIAFFLLIASLQIQADTDLTPIINPGLRSLSAVAGEAYEYDVATHFTAQGDTSISFSISGLPEGLQLSGSLITGEVTATTVANSPYVLEVTATADDVDSSQVTGSFVLAAFSGRDSVDAEVLLISTPKELDSMRHFLASGWRFKLATSLDFSGTEEADWMGEDGWLPIGDLENPFQGELDGDGYAITGIGADRSETDYLGIFGYIGSEGTVQNLGIGIGGFRGRDYVGGIAGYNEGELSGIVSIDNQFEVYGRNQVGGLVGGMTGTLQRSLSRMFVAGEQYVGGLVGNNAGDINESLFYAIDFGDISVAGASHVGGIAGQNSGEITDTETLALVTGTSHAGTGIGHNGSDGVLTNILAGGAVQSEAGETGRLVGSSEGTVTQSFWANAGSDPDGLPGTKLSSIYDFLNQQTFLDANWDFDTVWGLTDAGAFIPGLPVPKWLLNASAPRMSRLKAPISRTSVNDDRNGTVSASKITEATDTSFLLFQAPMYRVVEVLSGTLLIGGEPFATGTNDLITSERNGFWEVEGFGLVEAFTVVAVDNRSGEESEIPVTIIFNVNRIPVASGLEDILVQQGVPFLLDLTEYFTDPEEAGPLSFSSTELPPGLSRTDAGIISGTPTTVGSREITLLATDADGATGAVFIQFTVIEANYEPVIRKQFSNLPGIVGEDFSYDLTQHFYVHPDRTLTYSATGLPEGFTISNGMISGGVLTAAQSMEGPYQVTVTATTDDEDAFDISADFVLGVFAGREIGDEEVLLISSFEQLNSIRHFLGRDWHFRLQNHLNFIDPQTSEPAEWEPIGEELSPFEGEFDGGGYTINGLVSDLPDRNFVGLFAVVGEQGSIRNLTLDGSDFTGRDYTGGLAGLNKGTIEQVHIREVSVSGYDRVGALAGENRGTLSKVSSTGGAEGRYGVGGLAGQNWGGQINGAAYLHDALLSSKIDGDLYVGTVAGYNNGTIRNSVTIGKATGSNQVGALVGLNTDNGNVINSLSSGVAGTVHELSGRLVGLNQATITESFWVESDSEEDGLPGNPLASLADLPNETALRNLGWDFDLEWGVSSVDILYSGMTMPKWLLELPPARFTQINGPLLSITADEEAEAGTELIASNSDSALFDLSEAHFRVVAVHNGSLQINGEPFDAVDNALITPALDAVWSPGESHGLVEAYSLVAVNPSSGQAGDTPVKVVFEVNGRPQDLGLEDVTVQVADPFSLDLNEFIVDPEDSALDFSITGLPDGLTVTDGVISGTPTQAGVSNLDIVATDEINLALQVSMVLTVEALPPPPPATPDPSTPSEEIDDEASDLTSGLDEIVIPPAGQQVTPEVVGQVNQALDRAAELIENAQQQIASGNLNINSALNTFEAANKALEKASSLSQNGNGQGTEGAVRSIQGMSSMLSALADRGNLTEGEKAQIGSMTKTALSNSSNLIRPDSTAEEVESVFNATADVLNNALKSGAPLDEDMAAAAVQVSLKALNQLLPGLATALGKDVDLNDEEQVRQLMSEPAVLESALSKAVPVRSTVEVDGESASQALTEQGVNVAAAERILASLRTAISNPAGITIAGTTTRTATQSLVDALLNAFGTGSVEGLQGAGLNLFALSDPVSVTVDPVTGAMLLASDSQRYAVTSTNVRLVSSVVPEGVSWLPDGRAVAVSNGMAIELAPAAVDLLGFAAAIEKAGFGVTFRNNGSVLLDLGSGESFSGVFAFDDIGVAQEACGEISFAAPTGEVYSAGYAFEMQCENGVRQHILPFVHEAGFYQTVGKYGLTVQTDRNTGIITLPGMGSFKPSFFVSPLTEEDVALRSEQGNPAVAIRAVTGADGEVDYDLISASGVQRLYSL